MDRVKNPNPIQEFPITTLLLASFIVLFAIQVMSGVSAESPSGEDLLKWGANTLLYSALSEPWRLLSAGFLHIGIMHLLFNGFAMYFFGQVAERMLGSLQFLALFLLAVVGGNILNCYVALHWLVTDNQMAGLSAGASGGIMGIGAALLVFSLLKVRISGVVLNVSSLLMIMAINLSYGFIAPNVDNAGHIGGAITGAVLALTFSMVWRLKDVVGQFVFWSTGITIGAGFFFVWQLMNTQLLQMIG